jgi:hypothetical protein
MRRKAPISKVKAAVLNCDLFHACRFYIINFGYMLEDVRVFMSIMESGKYNLESIIMHEFALKDISEAITTAGKVDEALNVVIYRGVFHLLVDVFRMHQVRPESLLTAIILHLHNRLSL